MTNFSDLPYEIRIKILKINVKIAFKNRVTKFDKIYNPRFLKRIFNGNFYIQLSDFKREFYISVSDTTINQFMAYWCEKCNLNRCCEYSKITWKKTLDVWDVENEHNVVCEHLSLNI